MLNMQNEESLLFAIPKKGRLFDRVNKLLRGVGLDYTRPARVDIAVCNSVPVRLVFLPASDIVAYVAEGKVDLGITGQDIIQEYGQVKAVNELETLGFGKCKLGVQTPMAENIRHAKDLAGKRIVTSFPNISKAFFKQFEKDGVETKIKYVSGSVEAACELGLADGVVDLVETGTTMRAAGLELISTIMETQAVLISNPHTSHPQLVHKIHQRIRGFLVAQQFHMISYNVVESSLTKALQLTPGRKAPNVTHLANNSEFVSVSSMVEHAKAAEIMDQLAEMGATDIILFNIDNCRV